MTRQLSDEQLNIKHGHLSTRALEYAVGACLTRDVGSTTLRDLTQPHCPFCLGSGCVDSQLHGRRIPLMRELQKVVGSKIACTTDRGCTGKGHHSRLHGDFCIRILRVDDEPGNPAHKRPCAACEYAKRIRPSLELDKALGAIAGHGEIARHVSNIEADVTRRMQYERKVEDSKNKDETSEVMARLRKQVEGLQQGQARLSSEKQKANEKVARRDKQIERMQAQIKDLTDQLRGLKGNQSRAESARVTQLRHELQRLTIKHEAYVTKAEGKERVLRGQLKTEFNNGKASVQSARSAAERTLTNNNKKLRKDNKTLSEDHEKVMKIAKLLARELRDCRHLMEVNDIRLSGYEGNDNLINDLLG